MSRRSYLGIIGAATVSTAVASETVSADQYDEVVDIVEAGADDSGEEPIDPVFDEHATDDTLIEFPEGEYVVNDLGVYGLSNFGMVGDDATLVPGDEYNEDLWIAGGDTHDFRFEGFTIDTTENGVSPQIDINATDGLVVRDIYKVGTDDAEGIAFGFGTTTSDGTALIENLVAPDGGQSVGLYVQSEGPVTVRNCRLENFDDNGVYASAGNGPVRVEGGRFWNNNVAQVRLGSPDSYVRDAEIGVDEDLVITDGTVNARGVRVSDGPGPVTIEDCEIRMLGSQGTGGVVGAFDGGSFTVRDCHVHVDRSYTTIVGSDTSYGVLVDDWTDGESGERLIEGTRVTGGGHSHGAMLFRRDDNTVRDSCIEQVGPGRDGVMFEESQNNEVANATIDVPDAPITLRDSSVRRSNVETEGDCSSTATSGSSGGSVPVDAGTVETAQAAGEWHSVGFDASFDDPVAFMGPASFDSPEPCHPRVRDVGDGFEFQLEEWLYQDGDHPAERAHYLTLEAGTGSLDGVPAEVGTLTTDNHFTRVSFDQSFDLAPVVLTAAQTFNGPNPIVTRQRDPAPGGVGVRVQEEEGEANGGAHRNETVAYLAAEPGVGTVGDRRFEVGAVDGLDHEWNRVQFSRRYDDPKLLAGVQTFNGPNPVCFRYRNLTGDGVDVRLQEERSADQETWHREERFGYLVVEGA